VDPHRKSDFADELAAALRPAIRALVRAIVAGDVTQGEAITALAKAASRDLPKRDP
jgi:hypothetical protein